MSPRMAEKTMTELKENYYALLVSILRKHTPEQSFNILEEGKMGKSEIMAGDIMDMARLKKTMTYRQIGEMYGLTKDAVYARIRRFEGRV